MARARSVSGTIVTPLDQGWELACASPGIDGPEGLDGAPLNWIPCRVPATAASALRAARLWSLDDAVDFDRDDWWWRGKFTRGADGTGPHFLCFGGLATLADVWVNGVHVLRSENMFQEHEIDVTPHWRDDNLVVIRCQSLGLALQARRPRPRWRTRLVEATQLRWFRTALVGRIPAWTPRAAPVGPWRNVRLETRTEVSIVQADLRVSLHGSDGVVDVDLVFDSICGVGPSSVTLRVGDTSADLHCRGTAQDGRYVATGSLRVARAVSWWPHTHGVPARYPVSVALAFAGWSTQLDFGSAGFRRVDLEARPTDGSTLDGPGPNDRGFSVRVNDVDVFCRGACWTPLDPAALIGTAADYRSTLEMVRRAGMNMVRVCGPFFYEEDAFYDACDELGILVWHDYAFANMDYPDDNPAFATSVEREVRGFLNRVQLSCCLAVVCGNSEVEQQAAMMGVSRALWRAPLFETSLRSWTQSLRPDLPYWPSTPSGGALPFSTDVGTAHYFGVGAYLRPLDDARRANIQFTTECLAFANVPDERMLDEWLPDATPPQHPRWKSRTPRDSGVGWDFDDVRDHYLRALFGIDPAALRYADVPRYLALSRVVTGEAMASTLAEWRRAGSRCSGALIWFLRDLWPSAGWGVLDARGEPKPAYYFVRRVLAPRSVILIDEGLNGLDAHVINESPSGLAAELRVALYRGEARTVAATVTVDVPPFGVACTRLAAMFEHFVDSTYAYRFGPPAHDVAVATLVQRDGVTLGESFHFPRGLPSDQDAEIGLEATARPEADGWILELRTRRFAQAIAIDVVGYASDDNYFHLAPGSARALNLRRTDERAQRPQGSVRPLNSLAPTKIIVAASSA